MANDAVTLEVRNGLAIVTLANPDKNRLNGEVLAGLQAALPRLNADDVRAVYL